ncbi:SsgA family sporulation/cell division regulator [Kitasatospora sp. NPDC085895]|uniref:SsgA family sporulation/cell division regulator n=1 Tax=Kitasatospora sp. NPDC085895 TaxID=3155057 RepID=UPI00344E799A
MIIAQAGAASIPAPVPGVVPLVLRYDSDDPFAVVLDFPDPPAGGRMSGGEPISWYVSRELLTAGLAGPVGDGDFRLVPVDGGLTQLEFHNRHGVALVQVATDELRGFLADTAEVVRPGDEHRQVSWPDTVEAFLRATE